MADIEYAEYLHGISDTLMGIAARWESITTDEACALAQAAGIIDYLSQTYGYVKHEEGEMQC